MIFSIFNLVAIIPELIEAIDKSVKAVEAQYGPGTGEQKKQAVIDALNSDYDVIDTVMRLPDAVDSIVKKTLIPALIDTIAAQFKVTTNGE